MTQRNQNPQGLAQPVRATSDGRTALVSGDAQIYKLIVNGLRPAPSMNPFQDLDISGKIPFKLNTPTTEGEVRAAVRRLSGVLEREERAKIPNKTLSFEKRPGELIMRGQWINLETDQAQDFEFPVSQSMGAE